MDGFLAARVADYMTREVVSIEPPTTLCEIEDLFQRHDFNRLPVLEGGALVGVVTKLDLLKVFFLTGKTVLPYDRIARLTAGQIMTREVIKFPPGAALNRVLQTLIDFRVNSFPVVEGGRVVGIIARVDILRALHAASARRAFV